MEDRKEGLNCKTIKKKNQ
jgi:hypothetical protein